MTIMDSFRKVIVQDEGELESANSSFEEENDDTNDADLRKNKSDSNSSEAEDEDELNTNASNKGWVDSIAKILKTNKPKGKKTLVLSKAKKLSDVKVKLKVTDFEIESKDGQNTAMIKTDDERETDEPLCKKQKRQLPSVRLRPNVLEKDRERTLSKIATKGVVQLFNAVKGQQKDIAMKLKEVGLLEVKRDKVLKNIDKRAFLDVLMGEKSQNVEELQKKSSVTPTWNVLRDDFMMGAKLKDWDKELEREEEVENERNIDSE